MIETWLNQDLQEAVHVRYLDGNVFSMDNNGNKVGVNVFSGGEPVTLSGSISANVIRSDGATVTVSGESSGNSAWVVLPQAAYAVPGVISVVIKNTVSSDVTTMGAVVANVYQSTTDTTVDPGTIIPSVQALITSIETAVASIPADYSSLWTSLAPAFSSSTSYQAGQYVTYNGGVYRFTTAHSGSWAAADATAVNVGGELYDVKSAISTVEGIFNSTIDGKNANYSVKWFQGYFNASGTKLSNTSYISTEMFSVPEGMQIIASINDTAPSRVESVSIREHNASTKARVRIVPSSGTAVSVMMDNTATDKLYVITIMGTNVVPSDADITLKFVSSLNDEYTKVLRIGNSIGALQDITNKNAISGYTLTSKKIISSTGSIDTISYDTNLVTNKIDCADILGLFITGSFSTNANRYSIAFYDDFNNCVQNPRRFYGETGQTELTDYYVEVPVKATKFIVGINYAPGTSTNDLPLEIKKIGTASVISPCYVAATGSDSNSGTSADSPFKTIQKAIDSGFKNIIVSPGQYQEQVSISGLDGVSIRCASTGTESVFDDNHARMSRAKVDNSVDITGLTSYDTIYRTAMTLEQTSSFYKVFIGQTIPVIYDGTGYYGRKNTYNAILWEVTGNSSTTKQLVPVLTEAACKATSGTFFYDGSYLYVNPYGGTISGKTYKRLNLDEKQTGITITGSNDITLDGIDACYFPYNNISIENSENITLRNCDSICSCYENGISVNTSVSYFNDCKSILAGADGFGVRGSGNNSFFNCSAFFCGDDGISHHDAASGVVDGGEWANCYKGGVSPCYGSDVTVKNVYCHDNVYGIYCVAESNSDRHTDKFILIDNILTVDNDTVPSDTLPAYVPSTPETQPTDIYVSSYNIVMFGSNYKTKRIRSGTFKEYGNTVLS